MGGYKPVKGDRVRVVLEGTAEGTATSPRTTGEFCLDENPLDNAVSVEKVEPPVTVFKPGDVVRSKSTGSVYPRRRRLHGVHVPLGLTDPASGSLLTDGDPADEFTSNKYELVTSAVKSLVRSARRVSEDGGAFLPTVFASFESMKIRARAGTVTLVAGPPGAMKTGLVLYLVLRWNVPTIYVAADVEAFEIVERSGAAITGDTMEQVRANPEKYTKALSTVDNVRFVYEDSPSYQDLELEVAAYAEVFGRFPEVIVVDNVVNLVGESEDEWAAHRDHAHVLHALAHRTQSAVIALAHMADDRQDPSTPAARSKLMGKISALPKAIWSLALDGDKLLVSPVKNKWGREYPSGQVFATVSVDPSRSRFYQNYSDLQNGHPA
jgi:hypothetical protein